MPRAKNVGRTNFECKKLLLGEAVADPFAGRTQTLALAARIVRCHGSARKHFAFGDVFDATRAETSARFSNAANSSVIRPLVAAPDGPIYIREMLSAHAQAPHQSWPAFLAVTGVVLTLFVVFLAPEETRSLSIPALVLFWALHVMIPLVLLQASQTLISNLWPDPMSSTWPQIAAAGVIGAVLFTPLALGMDALFGLNENDAAGPMIVLDEFLGVGPPLVLVWLALNASRVLRLPPLRQANEVEPDNGPAFWDRVPDALGRDLVALSAELHYIRVTTARGDTLVLYPFGRAVEDLKDVQGMRVHRSHWVALAHVTDIERRGQGAVAHLTGGLSIPVSRSYRKALTDAVA